MRGGMRNAMPEQPADVRNKNFEEVAMGYTLEQAVDEAQRCLNCPKPRCVTGCPVNVEIPQFIHAVAEQNFAEAIKILKRKNSLSAVCGRVCPQEKQCESKCVLGIKGESVAIGRLERFVADYARVNGLDTSADDVAAPNGKKVAIVGSGPSGLTVAGDLAKMGYDVTIFEAFHVAGGVLMYGIPQFRLPKEIVQHEINNLKNLGVKIVCNAVIGRTFTINELMEEEGFEVNYFMVNEYGIPNYYEAVFLANNDMIENEPEVLQGFLRASEKGFRDFKEDPYGCLNILLDNQNEENFPLSESVEQKSSDTILPLMETEDMAFLGQTEECWEANIAWMKEQGLIKNEVAASDVMVSLMD